MSLLTRNLSAKQRRLFYHLVFDGARALADCTRAEARSLLALFAQRLAEISRTPEQGAIYHPRLPGYTPAAGDLGLINWGALRGAGCQVVRVGRTGDTLTVRLTRDCAAGQPQGTLVRVKQYEFTPLATPLKRWRRGR